MAQSTTWQVFATSKLLAVSALLAGSRFARSRSNGWNLSPEWSAGDSPWLPLLQWDGQHYLSLALHGYPRDGGPSAAFQPLFPALIAVGHRFGADAAPLAIALVTLCSLGVLCCAARLVPQPEQPPATLWLLASFPTFFFLSVAYSEALFLLLLLALLLAIRRQAPAGVLRLIALALPLARGQGIWLLAPAALSWLMARIRKDCSGQRIHRATTTGTLLGTLLYLGFYGLNYNNPWLGWELQNQFVFQNSLWHILDLPRFLSILTSPPSGLFAYTNSALDKGLFLILVPLWLWGARRCNDLFVLSTGSLMLFIPATMGAFGSYGRFALVPWVLFCLTAGPRLPRSLKWLLILVGFSMQAGLAFRFGGNHWVG